MISQKVGYLCFTYALSMLESRGIHTVSIHNPGFTPNCSNYQRNSDILLFLNP